MMSSSPTEGHAGTRPAAADTGWQWRGWLAGATVATAALLAYWPSLRNGFVWDDPLVLRQLEAIRTWGDLLVVPPEIPHYYYRPVVFVSYLADRWIGGGAPMPFHASVVVLHAFASVLVFVFARRCLPASPGAALLGALLFAVSPLHTESVAWMAGRSDVIAGTLLLLTVLLCWRDSVWSTCLGAAVFLLALLSKEMAIAGLLLVPAGAWLQSRRVSWRGLVPLAVATGIYAALRHVGLGTMMAAAATGSSGDTVGMAVRGLGVYVARSLVPFGLSPLVSAVPTAAPYLVLGALGPAVAAYAVYRWWPESRWPAAFLILWFLFTLAPAFTVMFRVSASAPIADRYLYVPSVATCILLAWGLAVGARRWRVPSMVAVGAAGAALAGLVAATWSYQAVWRDDYAFWSAAAAAAPDDGLAQRELGSTLLALGRLDDAERTLKRALELPADPTSAAMTNSNLAMAYRRMGRFDDAVAALNAAIAISPHPALYNNLGLTWMAKAQADQNAGNRALVGDDVRAARDALNAALAFEASAAERGMLEQWNPAKTHALLGQVLTALGDRSAARAHLDAALRLEPTGPMANQVRQQLNALR